jgi:hypothetical protein
MKPRLAVTIAILCLCWGTALAVGGGSSQGTLFLGQGIDWQHTGTEQQTVPHSQIPFPPKDVQIDFKDSHIAIEGCQPTPAGRYYTCKAFAKLLPGHSRSQLCGQWLPSDGGASFVELYALPGEVQDAGVYNSGVLPWPYPHPVPSKSVTLACAITHPYPPATAAAEWSDLGALGKCLHWPIDSDGGVGKIYYSFLDGAAGVAAKRFMACVRAVRADYCGDGVTYTTDGTKIYLADMPDGGVWSVDHNHDAGLKLEATWDERGAVCLHHARHALLSPECVPLFPVQRFFPEGRNKDNLYYCKADAGFEPGILMDDSAIQQ